MGNNVIDREILNRSWYQASLWTAVVSGVFTFMIIALLIANYLQTINSDPLDSEELAKLKAEIFRQPKDEALKEKMRNLDLQLRQKHFRHREFSRFGSYLLIVNTVIFLVSAKFTFDYRKELPMPYPLPQTSEARTFRFARWAVGGFGLSIAAIIIALIILNVQYSKLDTSYLSISREQREESGGQRAEGRELRAEGREKRAESEEGRVESREQRAESGEQREENEGQEVASIQEQPSTVQAQLSNIPPSQSEIKKNWPVFRGPGGSGISAFTNIPTSWNGKTGAGIRWKSPVPLPGKNSPIVWGNRVFVTGATETTREVYCFDGDTGKLLWQKSPANIPSATTKPPEVTEDTGYAAPTAATDGQRVYAIFANGDLVAFDFNGNQIWGQNLGPIDSTYGYSSSLNMYQNILIVLLDQGGTNDGISDIIGIDGPSGKTVWKTPRPVGNSWASTIVINTGQRDEVIAAANPFVMAYDPKTGKELWRVKCLSGDVAPSPVYGGGLVFATNAYATLAAIKPGGSGDVTKTNIVWQADDGLPDICSPLTNGELVFLLETYGNMTCYDAKNGNKVWEHDTGATFNSSPSLVGDNIYLISEEGVTIIVKAAREFKEVGRSELDDKVFTCPAFVNGRMLVRGEKNLYCIGK